MGVLYSANSYSTLAVFENGVVYDDARKISVLGTYSNGTIYSGSGIYSNCVGFYSGGQIKGSGYLQHVQGYITGNTVYSGNNTVYSKRVATFNGDSEGAAAAALLLRLFDSNSEETETTNYQSASSTCSSYGSKSTSGLWVMVYGPPVLIFLLLTLDIWPKALASKYNSFVSWLSDGFHNIINTITTFFFAYISDSLYYVDLHYYSYSYDC